VPKPDDLTTRVLKLVPGEVAAGYTALLAIVSAAGNDSTIKYAALTAIAACSILIVMLIRQAADTHVPRVKAHPFQFIASLLAFWAWAFSIRNPLEGFGRELPPWISGFAIVLVPLFGALILRDRPSAARKTK
jgi:hypothetical protein